MRPIATDVVCSVVCVSVCLSVCFCFGYTGKLCKGLTLVCPRNCVLDEVPDSPTGKGTFEGDIPL